MELSREESGSILRRRAPTDNSANMGIEADTKLPWNECHIGTGKGHSGVTDLNIGRSGYSDAQCGASVGKTFNVSGLGWLD